MTKKLIQIAQHTQALQLTWVINNICTNHCDYCPPTLHSGTNHHYDWDIARGFVDRLINRYSKIHCSITGGEPTLSPFFPELVKMFHDAGHSIGITSNGGRSVRYLEEIAPILSYICFSYHPSYEDPKFLEKVLATTNHTNVSVRVMMDSRYWDQAVEMYKTCCQITSIRVEPVKILAEMADRHIGDDYSPEQLQWLIDNPGKDAHTQEYLKSNPKYRAPSIGSRFFYDDGSVDEHGDTNHIISTNQNDFRGWSCNIGIESLFIHWDGFVKKGNCYQGGELFHLNNHAVHKLPDKAEICVQKICHCGTDIMISKVPMFDGEHPFIKENMFNKLPKTAEEYAQAYGVPKATRRPVIKIKPEPL